MNMPAKPAPVVNSWTKPFWEGVKEGKLLIQECAACGQKVFYPRMSCPYCFSDQLKWVPASGRGTVYSYTVVRSNAPSAFLADMPFVIAIIRLEEGVQMASNIVGISPEEVYCDMPVQVVFEDVNGEFTLPLFKPA